MFLRKFPSCSRIWLQEGGLPAFFGIVEPDSLRVEALRIIVFSGPGSHITIVGMFWVGEGFQMSWQQTFQFTKMCALFFPGYRVLRIAAGFDKIIQQADY